MKTRAAVFTIIFLAASAQCQAKELRRKKSITVTPRMMIEAAVEVFTCKPLPPKVVIVKGNEGKTDKGIASGKENKR